MVYSSYGVMSTDSGSVQADYVSYTGREAERNLGIYYYRARYYDPLTGRFMVGDPLGFAAGDVNLYRYVGNDPINLRDPSGTIIEKIRNNPQQRAEHLPGTGFQYVAVSYDRFLMHAEGRSYFTLITEADRNWWELAGPSRDVRWVIDPANPIR
jgi:RHS repeat-associated protein